MLIIPAIDLQDGCVVRLLQGKFKEKKIYSRDPLKTARHWVKQGAEFLHLVDLDGAATGTLKNTAVIKEIVKNIGIPVECGGGIRTLEDIEMLFSYGVKRVVLGTKAVEDIPFLKKVFKQFGTRVIVSIDAKDNFVLVKGWVESAKKQTVANFALQLKKLGFKELIYTDTTKDGMLKGPNIRSIKELLRKTEMKIIASGGVSSLDDIYRLKLLEKDGVRGVIIGKALYEGRFTLNQALKIA